ncbi:MAG: hypothetical protein LBC70_05160 [Chitinispirillales bacterium]|jgi:lipopolysaccharide export system protein LptA|nr:hypothetical protein [Chitinispirillales bacterium]
MTDRRHGNLKKRGAWVYLCAAHILFILAGLTLAQTGENIDTAGDTVININTVNADVDTNINADTVSTDTDISAIVDTTAGIDTIPTTATHNEVADTVFYEADFVDYDNEERILTLFGRAQVKYQNITLQADTIIYTVSNDQFQARGMPQLIEGKDTTVGDFMVYNIKTRRGRVSYAMTRFDDTFVTGSNIVKTPENNLYIEQGDYTTCQFPEHPHYYFYGRHIKVVPNDKVISRPVILNIGDAPIAVLPYFVMPMQRGRRSGWLTPSWGGSVSHGGYVDNLGYYYAPNDYYDLTMSTKIQEFNSFVFNARGRYALRYVLDGEVSGRYVMDNRLEDMSRQWALDYRHNQFLRPDGMTRLSGQGSILSNRTFNQLYSDNTNELENQQLNANMSLSHRFQSINASTNVTWRRNHNLVTDRIIEDMPSFDFNLPTRAFIPYNSSSSSDGPSWYNNIFYSYNTKANVRRDVYGNDSLPGFIRPGMQHRVNLTSSQKLLKYLDVSPYLNMNSSMFYGAIDTLVTDTVFYRDTLVFTVKDPARDVRAPGYILDSQTPEYRINEFGYVDTLYRVVMISPVRRHLVRDTLNHEFNTVSSWNTGVNLSTRIYGMFPVGAFGITNIRHIVTPTVGYAYVPKHELDRMFYNVGIDYDRARPQAQQLVRFSLANQFQGKRIVATPDNEGRDGRRGAGGGTNSGGSGGPVDRFTANDRFLGVHGVSADSDNDDDDDDYYENGDDNDLNGDGLAINDDGDDDSSDTTQIRGDRGNRSVRREQKFDILSFSLNTSYDFEADDRKWRDLSLNANTSLRILNVTFTSTFWLYDQSDNLVLPIARDYNINLTSGRLGVSGTFWDGDLLNLNMTPPGDVSAPAPRRGGGGQQQLQRWDMSLSPSFSYRATRTTPEDRFTPTKSFNVSSSAGLHLTNALSARWNGNYDFSSGAFTHNNFTFICDLECWEMRFTWRPEKINPGFHFVVSIKKIPDIKWEQRESRTTRVL